jgi:hypothetical protein
MAFDNIEAIGVSGALSNRTGPPEKAAAAGAGDLSGRATRRRTRRPIPRGRGTGPL